MAKKKRFTVELTAMAHVRQRRNVIASDEVEAVQKAKETYNDNTWDYCGIEDNSVQVKARNTGE